MNEENERPRYLRIADALRTQIAAGELEDGARLPSIPEMVREHGIASSTAQRVINVLVSEGLAIAKPGSGTYVRTWPEKGYMVCSWHRNARGGSPFKLEMEGQGAQGNWDYESRTDRAPGAIRERLALDDPADDRPNAMHTSYLYRRNGRPAQLAESWEPLALTRHTPIVLPEDGPYAGLGVVERMRQIGVRVTHSNDDISARHITLAEAQRLEVAPGEIVLTRTRTYYADTLPVETADIVVPASLYTLKYGTSIWDEPAEERPQSA
ncbi:GntR family transcriptional regulator [Microbispora amethystogenes]|uniref:GntR family transcriptional regulator n=1 Tax=Microbispora amethystogenes TaxID=1427754 RepID=UPI0033FBF8BF